METLIKMLALHAQEWIIQDGRLLALYKYAHTNVEGCWEDLTDMTRREVLEWLGY